MASRGEIVTRPDGRTVSAYVADAMAQYGRSETLRELLDSWWAEDPAGPPTDTERAVAQTALGLAA